MNNIEIILKSILWGSAVTLWGYMILTTILGFHYGWNTPICDMPIMQ